MSQAPPTGRYGGVPAAQRRAERRARFLQAGLQLYGTEGYSATSTDRLCEVAGLSTRQFYEEFANRNEVLVELYDQINDEAAGAVTEAVRAALAEGAGVREIVQRALHADITTTASDVRRARVAYVTIVGVSPEIERHRMERRQRWTELLCALAADAAARGDIPARDYTLTMRAFIGATNGIVYDWCSSDPRPPLEDITDTLTHLLHSALITPPPSPRPAT